MKNIKTQRFFGELVKLPNGKFKARNIKKLISLNQYKRTWQPVNARNFARDLNKSQIVIK